VGIIKQLYKSEFIIFLFGVFYVTLLCDTLSAFLNLPLLSLTAKNSGNYYYYYYYYFFFLSFFFFLRVPRNFGTNAAYSLELTMSLFSEFRPDNTIFN